jgi:hypothetical protein
MGITPTQFDIGREASSGFQSGPRSVSRPNGRDRYRIDLVEGEAVRSNPVEGGGFQTAVKRDDERLPFTGTPEQKDEATND